MFTLAAIKIQADGALGSRGAALHAPYSDQHDTTGLLLQSPQTTHKMALAAMLAGFQVNIHAIGDKANTLVLDVFEQQIKATNSAHLRHRNEHAQVVRPEEIKRFNALNVIASIQPTHATSDKNMALDRLGAERLKGAYAWRTLLNNGARIAAGSDFPVEPPHPFMAYMPP